MSVLEPANVNVLAKEGPRRGIFILLEDEALEGGQLVEDIKVERFVAALKLHNLQRLKRPQREVVFELLAIGQAKVL